MKSSGTLRLALAMSAIGMAAPALADSDLPAIGGTGGAQYRHRCPDGLVLTGFDLRAGDDIDAIHPLCGEVHGPADVAVPPAGDGFGRGWFGGPGGGFVRMRCPPSTPVVTAINVYADGVDTISVDRIDIFCSEVGPARNTSAYPSNHYHAPVQDPGGSYLAVVEQREDCPAGTVAIGLHGRSGRLVDAMGLICGTTPATGRPPPAFARMGHVDTRTPVERATEGATVNRARTPATAAALNPQPLPPGNASGIRVSATPATANTRGIIIVGGKPQAKKTSQPTVLQRIQGDGDNED